jgi:crotonobetainyl-CoA:carnitine CoA-transferase CaiB-like acyl-CoA transferase
MDLPDVIYRCEKAQIPFSPIARPEDLFEDPQLNEGNSLVTVQLPDGRQAKLPRLPLAAGNHRFGLRNEAPTLGQHTRPLLKKLGYSDATIDRFQQNEVIVATNSQAINGPAN